MSSMSRAEAYLKEFGPMAGGEDATAEAEATESTEVSKPADAETGTEGDTATAVTSPARRTVVNATNGETMDVSDDEYKSLADMGFAAFRQKQGGAKDADGSAETAEVTETAEAETGSEDDDPVARQLAETRQELSATKAQVNKLTEDFSNKSKSEEAKEQEAQNRRYLGRLAKRHHVDLSDEITREQVELRATNIYNEARSAGKSVSFEDAYAQGAKQVGARQSEKHRTWIEGKVETKAKAGEAPGGTAGVLPAAPSLPESKEEQRKIVADLESGATNQRARQRLKSMMNAAP